MLLLEGRVTRLGHARRVGTIRPQISKMMMPSLLTQNLKIRMTYVYRVLLGLEIRKNTYFPWLTYFCNRSLVKIRIFDKPKKSNESGIFRFYLYVDLGLKKS